MLQEDVPFHIEPELGGVGAVGAADAWLFTALEALVPSQGLQPFVGPDAGRALVPHLGICKQGLIVNLQRQFGDFGTASRICRSLFFAGFSSSSFQSNSMKISIQ